MAKPPTRQRPPPSRPGARRANRSSGEDRGPASGRVEPKARATASKRPGARSATASRKSAASDAAAETKPRKKSAQSNAQTGPNAKTGRGPEIKAPRKGLGDKPDNRPERPARRHAAATPDRPRNQRARGLAKGPPNGPATPMRIAKAMARAGLCSRRDAEVWIAEGRVAVNGKRIASPALNVGPSDRILVDDFPLPRADAVRLWRYYKPKGLVTSHKDPQGRPTVFDALPDDLPRVVSIGRLDFNTEGLLLLTNDGGLARHLELPSTGWLRRYRVRAHLGNGRGPLTQAELDALKNGIEIEGVRYGAIEATLDTEQGDNVWLTVGIREGKNREVRRVLQTLDLDVNRLIRTSYGPFQLLDMKPGTVENIRRRVLIDQFGAKQARALGLSDDDDELPAPRAGGKAVAGAAAKGKVKETGGGGRSTKPRAKRLELVDKPLKPKRKSAAAGRGHGTGGAPAVAKSPKGKSHKSAATNSKRDGPANKRAGLSARPKVKSPTRGRGGARPNKFNR